MDWSWSRTAVLAAFLGAMLLGTSATAEAHDRCRERIQRAEVRLNKAIQRHGYNSRQAQKRRRELERENRRCRFDHRGYWR